MYLPAFRNAINAGERGDYFGIQVGEAFIKQWRAWQGGPLKRQNNAIVAVVEAIKDIFGFEQFTVTSSDKNDDLQLTVDGRSFRLREMGSGLAQFIITLGNVVIQEPSLLLVDEPELNLHPALQRRFLMLLSERAQSVVMATHNLALARAFGNHAYSLRRKNQTIKAQPLHDPRSLRELMGEMSYGALRELGCSSVLFVEGAHDVTVYTVFVQRLGLGGDIAVFPLNGDAVARGEVAPQLAELRRLGDEIAVILDSERTSADASAKSERQKFLREVKAQSIPCHLTEFRAIENYFPDHAVKSVVPTLSALSPFEEAPRSWAKQKSQNWKMATNMTIDEIKSSDIGKFLVSWMAARKPS
jgi:energy-coupling factor transporter ATP-binding protein EcfA2